YVVDLWAARGRPPSMTAVNEAPMPDPEEDWEHAFANGRDLLVAGHYAEAARRFDALVGAAHDLVAGARAAELRALAREVAPAAPPAPPAAPAKAPPPGGGEEEEGTRERKTETRWYGWQTLISDGIAVV